VSAGYWRRLALIGLAALLLAYTVEAAVHSVHHIGHDHATAECWMAGAANHAPVACDLPASIAPGPLVAVLVLVDVPVSPPLLRALGTRQERAPPLVSAA
jgi:hypothetical protein